MAQVGNNENRFGGEYYIQDRDHMSDIKESQGAQRGDRQVEQSQTAANQQGSDQQTSGQQGGERGRKTR